MTAGARMGVGGALALMLMLTGCAGSRSETPRAASATAASASGPTARERPATCPEQAPAPRPLPQVDEARRQLSYWLEASASVGDLDAPLLHAAGIRNHGLALQARVDHRSIGQADLSLPPDEGELLADVRERVDFLRGRFTSGGYVAADGSAVQGARLSRYASPDALPALDPRVRVALANIPLRCGPEVASFFTPSLDPDFDRNNCSTIHAQQPVQILARYNDEVLLVRARYAMGFIAADAPLSPVADAATVETLIHATRLELLDAHSFAPSPGNSVPLPAGALLPPADGGVLLATATSFVPTSAPAELLRHTQRTLTRRALLEEAFRWLDAPYGWGGNAGGHDCSRFLLDVFESFGLHLPRHSGRQALAGTFGIDVSSVSEARDKLPLLDAALTRGVVLLHFPGHIMLYLGRDAEGEPMVIHAFSEYVVPCGTSDAEGTPLETLRRVDRVAVSDLSLGQGSSRGSFLERIDRIIVIGHPPGRGLAGVSTLRPAHAPALPPEARCDDSSDDALFRTPRRPWPGAPLRVIATSTQDPGPATLVVYGPDDQPVPGPTHVLGGPPFSRWQEIPHPAPGIYHAVLGDGERVIACERFAVARRAQPEPDPRLAEAPAWEPAWHWERDTENLYSAFVEQLFREPVDGDVTFTSLSEVLRDPARNLLFNHRGLGEDALMELVPDCADLPYFLRAYFAWQLRLPFGFRHCNRGRPGRPPSCGELVTNLEPTAGMTEPEAFARFIRRVARGVHSASGRTPPSADATDYYPVDLDPESLPPGTVFADPYGHVLIVAGYRAQGLHTSGALIGADAQPDGTVGRRRFWRGSFLFTPDITDVGAGFKAFRPLRFDEELGAIVAPSNQELRGGGPHVRYSRGQYRGSADDFYERMEAVIDPRPVDAMTRQLTLVDALEEAVRRRVVSVNNGEAYVTQHPGRAIEMPVGYDIFETEGPWEDFSTPSRDMRLLISLDAVLGFPRQVARTPARFGVAPEEAAQVADSLEQALRRELDSRHFEYQRSDGQPQSLSLADVAQRAQAFELSYNPNDCVELRWAAAPDSAEAQSCRRHAPAAQRQRMHEYRPWFHSRQRPLR